MIDSGVAKFAIGNLSGQNGIVALQGNGTLQESTGFGWYVADTGVTDFNFGLGFLMIADQHGLVIDHTY